MKQRVAITTLGCKINQFESAAMAETLGLEGFQVVPFEEAAEIYVINICTVTARADAESRRLIRRARNRQPEAKIVVTGCYAQVAFDRLQTIPGVSLILGNTEKKGIAGLLREIGDESSGSFVLELTESVVTAPSATILKNLKSSVCCRLIHILKFEEVLEHLPKSIWQWPHHRNLPLS